MPIKTLHPAIIHHLLMTCSTVGKRNNFTGYGILLHNFPVVAVLFTHSNNKIRAKDATFSSSCVGIEKCRFVKYGTNLVK